jgi:deoxyadenosine/deoxycytidine kinase
MHQISLRGRDFEQSIKREYLEQLNRHYESWIARYSRGKLLVVESDGLDFVNRPDDLKKVLGMVAQQLAAGR